MARQALLHNNQKFYFFLLLINILSCSEKQSNNVEQFFEPIANIYTLKTSLNLVYKNDMVFFNDKKYSGYVFDMQNNHIDTLFIESYQNGLQSGLQKKWYPNGQVMEKRFYANGKKNGLQTAYWENGKKRFEFTAKDDAYEGELKEWSLDGQLYHLATFKNGQEEGVQKMWYNNGKIRANYVMKNGKRYGLLGTKNCKNVSDSIFITP